MISRHVTTVAHVTDVNSQDQSPLALRIVVASLKGGGGKSNIADNIAVAFQRLGHSVAIIDADRTMNTSEQWHDDREEYIGQNPDAGVELIPVVKKTGRIGSTIEELARTYNIVIIDTGGQDSSEMRSALGAVDVVLTPVEPTQESLDGVAPFLDIIEKVRDLGAEIEVAVVLSRVPPNSPKRISDAHEYLSDFSADGALVVTQASISNRVVYPDSKAAGLSVVESRDATAKSEVEALAAELLTITKGR